MRRRPAGALASWPAGQIKSGSYESWESKLGIDSRQLRVYGRRGLQKRPLPARGGGSGRGREALFLASRPAGQRPSWPTGLLLQHRRDPS